MSQTQMYTQEQLDLALIKNTQEGILRSFDEVKQEFYALRSDMREEFHVLREEMSTLRTDMREEMTTLRTDMREEMTILRTDMREEMGTLHTGMRGELDVMRAEIKSQGHWNIGLILGIYGMIGAAALGKLFGVL